MIRWIFWDNDGVLVDTEMLYYRACRDALRHVNIELTLPMFADISLTRGESVLDLAQQAGEPEETVRKIRALRDDDFAQKLSSGCHLVHGAREVLQTLSADMRMAIVTSCQPRHFQATHASTGILPHFDFILTQGMYAATKPDPAPYLAALAKAEVRPDEALVVEDSPRGIQSARAAGIRCVAVRTELSRWCDLGGAWQTVDRLEELPAIVRRLRDQPPA